LDLQYWLAILGLVMWSGGLLVLVYFLYAQEVLLDKWDARKNNWVTPGYRGMGIRVIPANNPPKEFEKEFNNRLWKKSGWIGSVSFVGFVLLNILGKY